MHKSVQVDCTHVGVWSNYSFSAVPTHNLNPLVLPAFPHCNQQRTGRGMGSTLWSICTTDLKDEDELKNEVTLKYIIILQVLRSLLSFTYVSNLVPDSSQCRAAAPRLHRSASTVTCSPFGSASAAAPRVRPLQLLFPDCFRFSCCSTIACTLAAAL